MSFVYEKIKIPTHLKKKEVKRGDKKKFNTLYYYKQNLDKATRTIAKLEATSKYHYKNDMFYRDTLLSAKSEIWDYYKVLKPNLPKKIAIPNKKVRGKKVNKDIKLIKEDGGFIVRFD